MTDPLMPKPFLGKPDEAKKWIVSACDGIHRVEAHEMYVTDGALIFATHDAYGQVAAFGPGQWWNTFLVEEWPA